MTDNLIPMKAKEGKTRKQVASEQALREFVEVVREGFVDREVMKAFLSRYDVKLEDVL